MPLKLKKHGHYKNVYLKFISHVAIHNTYFELALTAERFTAPS